MPTANDEQSDFFNSVIHSKCTMSVSFFILLDLLSINCDLIYNN